MSYMKREWERVQDAYAEAEWLFRLPDKETEEEFQVRKDWFIKEKFSTSVTTPGGLGPGNVSVPPPTGSNGPGWRNYQVLYMRHGEVFLCMIRVPKGKVPGKDELIAEAERMYGNAIDDFWAGCTTSLPLGCELQPSYAGGVGAGNYPTFQSAVKPAPVGNVVAAKLKAMAEDHAAAQSELFYGAFSRDLECKKDEPEPTCEADKPIGTRDVDKFLKEQQDKLWRDCQ